jgi:hypothetical protein
MRFWKVKVSRWSQAKPTAKPKRSFIWVLVAANDTDSAMTEGVSFAVNNAPFGPLWKEFEAIEAASVTLPFQLHGFSGNAQP